MTSTLQDRVQRALGSAIRIDRELGGGGMSHVFLATDLSLDRQVVVKVLSPEMSAGVSADRFRREIQLVAKLQHPHVVPILSAGDAEGALYYVMPFISGEPLRARLAREGPMSVTDTVRILRETLDALSFAHKHGVLHRDIKPDNILIGAGHAVVADFGVSKALKDSSATSEGLTSLGMSIGTPAYMAPEQAAADPDTDHRADLYAVGVVAYEMLTGAPPFSGTPSQLLAAHLAQAPTDIRKRRSDVPDALADVVMRALEKDPHNRPQSADEMMSKLDSSSLSVATTPVASVSAAAASTQSATTTDRDARTAAASDATRVDTPMKRDATRSRSRVIVASVVVFAVIALTATWYMKRASVAVGAQSMAIMPFAVADGDSALVRLGQNLVTTMSANLDGIGEIHTADAMSVLSHAKGSGGTLTLQQAADIARKVGVRSVVYGTLSRAQASVRADVALYETDALTTPIARVSASVPVDSVSALTDSLTWKLLREVWTKGKAPTPNAASIRTHNPAALREFLEGERQFARGDIDAATDAYARAVSADTTFYFAHYRYRIARDWFSRPMDTSITHRLSRHLRDLPERESQLLLAIDSSVTISERLGKIQTILAHDPDYIPALLSYGDYVLHHAMRAGYDVKDAIAPFTRLTQLVPTDFTSAEHLTFAYLATGDVVGARIAAAHYDSLVRSDPKSPPLARFTQGHIALALNPTTPARLDSLASESVRDSVPRFIASVSQLPTMALILPEHADLLTASDKIAAKVIPKLPDPIRQSFTYGQQEISLARGDGTVLDALAIDPPPNGPFTPGPRQKWQMEQQNLRTRVLMELQGLIPATSATAERALAAEATPTVSHAARVELQWIAAANALKRGDSVALRARVAELTRDTSLAAKIAVRSLRAIGQGFAGNMASAGDSLLVLEREHGDLRLVKVYGAFGADRLLGAQWLTSQKNLAPADSLLRFADGVPLGAHSTAVFPLEAAILLERSRIAEGMGNKAAALRFAQSFLILFDKAPDVAKPRIEEAKQRVARLQNTDVRSTKSP